MEWRSEPASMDEKRAGLATIKETMKEIKELLKISRKVTRGLEKGRFCC